MCPGTLVVDFRGSWDAKRARTACEVDCGCARECSCRPIRHTRRISHASHTPETSRHARVGGRVDNRCRRWGARARHRRTGETPVRRPGPDGTEPSRARILFGRWLAQPGSCPRPVGGFTRVLRSPDLKWLVRFCQTGPVAPRRRGRSRNSLGRAKCPGSLDKTTVHLPDSRGEPRKSVPRASDTPECGDR